MAIKRTLQINDKSVDVEELSVAKVRAWIKESGNKRIDDPIDGLLFDDFVVTDITCFTSLTPDEIDQLTPRELRSVIDVVKELNPHFFDLIARLAEIGKEHMKKLQNESGSSSATYPL